MNKVRRKNKRKSRKGGAISAKKYDIDEVRVEGNITDKYKSLVEKYRNKQEFDRWVIETFSKDHFMKSIPATIPQPIIVKKSDRQVHSKSEKSHSNSKSEKSHSNSHSNSHSKIKKTGGSVLPTQYDPHIPQSFFIWPTMCGCVGNSDHSKPAWTRTILLPGTIITRFGDDTGGFFGTENATYTSRGIPYIQTKEHYDRIRGDDIARRIENTSKYKFHRYRVVLMICLFSCKTAMVDTPLGYIPGGSIQYFMFHPYITNLQTIKDMNTIDAMNYQGPYGYTAARELTIPRGIFLEELTDISEQNYPQFGNPYVQSVTI
jgi:hypothetical protein